MRVAASEALIWDGVVRIASHHCINIIASTSNVPDAMLAEAG
jgi:hypothetical protein